MPRQMGSGRYATVRTGSYRCTPAACVGSHVETRILPGVLRVRPVQPSDRPRPANTQGQSRARRGLVGRAPRHPRGTTSGRRSELWLNQTLTGGPRMMQPRAKLLIAFLAILTVGWGLLMPEASAQSRAQCEAYARDMSLRASGGGALGGAARGTLRGGVTGRIVGGKKGAKKGRRIGAAVGGTRGAVKRGSNYNRAYNDCMNGRIY